MIYVETIEKLSLIEIRLKNYYHVQIFMKIDSFDEICEAENYKNIQDKICTSNA